MEYESAFPLSVPSEGFAQAGLTKREWYAGRALQSLLQDQRTSIWLQKDPRYNGNNFKEVVAINAFEFADAMIVESNKPRSGGE